MRALVINFLAFVFILFTGYGHAASIEIHSIAERLASISDTEKKDLARFFEEIIFKESFGYTIFGDKPISFTTYDVDKDVRYGNNDSSLIIERGEELLKKYTTIFQNNNFIFKFQAFANTSRHEIYLINKKAVHEIATKYLEIFKKILGNECTPEKLLHELEYPDTKVQDVLHGHEGLLGVLLGYGYKNAFAFQRRYEVIASIQNMLLHPLYLSIDQENVLGENFMFFVTEQNEMIRKASAKNSLVTYDNLFDEFLLLKEELRSFNNKRNFLDLFPLPLFMVLANDPETQFLLEKYKKVQSDMTYAYAQGNVLEVTLCKIIAN